MKKFGLEMPGSIPWDDLDYDTGHQHTHTSKKWASCHESHPEIELGGGVFIGASCSRPRPGADVYIGFDYSMGVVESRPWERSIEHVYFHVSDMSVPKNPAEYKKLVEWTAEQLAAGKTVHAGCIGGHGRTGMFLAALLSVINDDRDAILTARKIYCNRAVESATQVDFLVKHFGVNKAEAAKHKKHEHIEWTAPKLTAKEISSKKAGSPFSGAGRSYKSLESKRSILDVLI